MNRSHHTKQKADVGLAKVIADLASRGHVPCVPLSEHQPYDLVAALKDGGVVKIQVKYVSLKNGTIALKWRTSWADKKGNHARSYQKEEFDYFAAYCPELDKVLYIPNSECSPKLIRFSETANNQKKYVHWAADYAHI